MAYARATISDLVIKGGFPPFLLPLVTFEALHARAAQQSQQPEAASEHVGQLTRPRPWPLAQRARPTANSGPVAVTGRRLVGARRSASTWHAPAIARSCGARDAQQLGDLERDAQRALPAGRRLPAVALDRAAARACAGVGRRAPDRRAQSCVSRNARDRRAAAARGNARRMGHEGFRARLRAAAATRWPAPCSARMSARRCCRGPRSRGKSAPGLPTAMTIASRDERLRTRVAPGVVGGEFSRLQLGRRHRCRGRRRDQERAGDRRRAVRTVSAMAPTRALRSSRAVSRK